MKNFGLFFLCFWWLFWLTVSYSSFNPITPPSLQVSLLYVGSLFFVVLGYFFVTKLMYKRIDANSVSLPSIDNKHVKVDLIRYSLLSLFLVLVSLYLVGAFSSSFSDYFIRIRGSGSEALVSGSGLIDYGLKMILYPISLTILLITFSNPDGKIFRRILFLNIAFFLSYSYFFQVNYPIILLIVIVFYSLFNPCVSKLVLKKHRMKSSLPLLILSALIIMAAFNRFGVNDLSGMLSHYLVSYHTIGFALFDFYYNESDSLLHNHSFGLSFLGTFDFIFSYFVQFLGGDYISSTAQNVVNNSVAIDLGSQGHVKYSNAFGTYLFTFYRDFNFIGVIVYSFLYGAVLAITNIKAIKGDRFYYSLFLYLISMGTIGMYVSPFDYTYFWIVPLFMFYIKHKFKIL